MLNNPEFQRQLWLNWRPSLALWTLLLCSLILALPLVLSDAHERLASLGADCPQLDAAAVRALYQGEA